MIKLHHYSKEKFESFSPDKQIKAIIELLVILEKNLTDAEYRNQIVLSIRECVHWSIEQIPTHFRVLDKIEEAMNPHDVLKLIVPLINTYKANQVIDEAEILRFDGLKQQQIKAPYPLTVVLDNLRSAYNVGSIFRTAECVKAARLILCGITPVPPNPRLIKTAMGTNERVPWQSIPSTKDAIQLLKTEGIPILALETTSNSINLFEYKQTCPVAIILGNEALGIEEDILNLADKVLSIPVLGWKNSLNVCNAFAVAAYQLSGLKTTS